MARIKGGEWKKHHDHLAANLRAIRADIVANKAHTRGLRSSVDAGVPVGQEIDKNEALLAELQQEEAGLKRDLEVHMLSCPFSVRAPPQFSFLESLTPPLSDSDSSSSLGERVPVSGSGNDSLDGSESSETGSSNDSLDV